MNTSTPSPDEQASALGTAIRAARGHRSVRSVAEHAGLSEGRWRQIEAGYASVGGGQRVPVKPKATTVVQMAEAVGMDVPRALHLAGFDPDDAFGENWWLADRAGELRLDPPPADADPRPVGDDLDTRGLPEEDVQLVRDLVHRLKEARGISSGGEDVQPVA